MFRWCALILVLLLSLNGPVDARVRTTADAIIIEVDLNDERVARSAKTPSGTYLRKEENSCWTSDGHQGVCSSLRSCYPGYQLTELKNFESLNELSVRGTCQYYKADGLQAYGVCCPHRRTYFSPSFLKNFFGGRNPQFGDGKPQFGVGSFPWLQPAGFPWWGAGGGAGGVGGGIPSSSSFPSIPAAPPAPVAPVDMGPPPTDSLEALTENPNTTESWETWTPPTTTPSTTTKPSWESGITTTTTTQQSVISNPPPTGSGNKGAFEDVCGKGPYMVSMQSNQRHFCGGSLIDSQNILTAAHCIATLTSADVRKLEVVLAMHYTKGDTSAVRKRVSRLVRHKGYNAHTLYNDIAILKLDSPVTFGPKIGTVCLPPALNSHSEHYGKEATVIGWGATRFNGSLPEALQQVTIKVQTNEECKKSYKFGVGEILPSMICAGLPGKDSCQGDSGGPMVMQHGGKGTTWTQVGVVSWGIECAKPQFPGVYTSVAHFIGWINKNRT